MSNHHDGGAEVFANTGEPSEKGPYLVRLVHVDPRAKKTLNGVNDDQRRLIFQDCLDLA